MGGVKDWSTTASENDDASIADGVDWREGMVPAQVNNSSRAMMAQLAAWFTETAGGINVIAAASVGGTGDVVTITTSQADTYTFGQGFLFIAEGTNTTNITVNVDGQGAKAVNSHGEPLAAGAIVTGDVVLIVYDGVDFELVYPRRQAGVDFELVSDDAGAGGGPVLTLYRNSASPAVSDTIGRIDFVGEDSAGNKETYALIFGSIVDPTSTSEDARIFFQTAVAGSVGSRLIIQNGLYTPNATGTDKGADTINASGVYDDGLLLRGTPIARLEDQKVSGTDGGTFTSGADRTRDLNAEVYDPYSLVSISSNQFTLEAGTWLIRWSAPAYRTNSHQSFLYDITGAAEVKRGTTEIAENLTGSESENVQGQTRSEGAARVTIAAQNTYEIRHRASATTATSGFGLAAGFGTEVYAWVEVYAA